MPRDGSGIYSQPFPDVVEGTTIESAVYNGFTHDVEIDLNTPRPLIAGGTGASSADGALDNLKAEKFKQVVTNWDTTVWRAGSFYAATTAIGIAPVTGHAFAGIVYYANATDLVIEAVDLTNPTSPAKYIREMAAGVWGAWMSTSYASTKKNYILNGAMMVSQENGTTASTAALYYGADMWTTYYSGAGVLTTQNAMILTPSGSTNRYRVTVTTADTSIAAGDMYFIFTRVEGYRSSDLMWGTASAKTVTLQFGWKSPAGTYSVSISNNAQNRFYLATFTVSAGQANTDTVQSVTIPGDTTGAWLQDNNVGIHVMITMASGRVGVLGWQGGATVDAAPGTTNNVGTGGNVFELFDVSFTEGSVAPPFVVPDYVTELAACQRYWEKTYVYSDPPGKAYGTSNSSGDIEFAAAGTTSYPLCSFSYSYKRAPPTITLYSGYTGVSGAIRDVSDNADRGGFAQAASNSGATAVINNFPTTAGHSFAFQAVMNARL